MGLRPGDLAVLGVRTAIGTTIAAHGAQKLFGWFGGGGLTGTGDAFHSMGYRPGRNMALAAGVSEAVGGTALALGLGTPGGAAAVAGAMGAAAEIHTPHGFFNANGGYEYPGLIGLTAMSLIISGPGKVSLDHATGHCLDRPWMRAVAFVAVPAAVTLVIARKRAAVARDQWDEEEATSSA